MGDGVCPELPDQPVTVAKTIKQPPRGFYPNSRCAMRDEIDGALALQSPRNPRFGINLI